MTTNLHDHDPYDGEGADNLTMREWEARPSAGANLFGLAVCACIVAVLVFAALWQVTGP